MYYNTISIKGNFISRRDYDNLPMQEKQYCYPATYDLKNKVNWFKLDTNKYHFFHPVHKVDEIVDMRDWSSATLNQLVDGKKFETPADVFTLLKDEANLYFATQYFLNQF